MPTTARKPVTLRAIMELLQSRSDEVGYLDAPLAILVKDGHLHSEQVHLEELGWSELPRYDHGSHDMGGSGIAIRCFLTEHRLVKDRRRD